MAYIAVLGHGTVGSGVLEVILSHAESISRRAQEDIKVKHILDIRDFPDLDYSELFTKDFNDIVNDSEVSVVVEVMGGINPAFDFVKASLEAGKSVVTSNKELVATKGAELLRIARENHVSFLFEASVGGGVPIIRPIVTCLAANEVSEIAGILNGTTNFILTKMIREQMSFNDALKLAQDLGYAERNPAADIEGHDACRKICILASLTSGTHVYPDTCYTEGITEVTLEDVEFASAWGGVIKLIGSVKRTENDKIQIKVCPMFVAKDSQLANVDDVFNGIMVRGDATGDVVFYGKGAGKLPTASAVVADVIDCVKKKASTIYWNDAQPDFVEDFSKAEVQMYVRAKGENVIDKSEKLFGELRELHRKHQCDDEFAFIVPVTTEGELAEKLAKLSDEGVEILGKIRISDY